VVTVVVHSHCTDFSDTLHATYYATLLTVDLVQVYQHEEVLQLIKSRSNKQRLAILFKGKKRKDYLFDSLLVGYLA
jgi:hypothetical protein